MQKIYRMKKISLLFLIAILTSQFAFSQGVPETVKKKFTIGADVFTDIWQGVPDSLGLRTINQGANVFGMFNFDLGNGMTSFSIGLGIRNHNMYTSSRIDDVKGDTINFIPIPDGVIWRRSKINLVYLDLPVEFKIRFDNGMKLTVGAKAGWIIDSKEKYYGDRWTERVGVTEKRKDIRQLENFTYGPTFRIGYKFISLYGYYQISDVFKKGLAPEIRPISVGLTITPF